MTTENAGAIRALNDQLRANLSPNDGTALITPGVAALGDDVVARVFKTVAVYDDFCNANDPYEEHDFGALDVDGHTIFSRLITTTLPSPVTPPIRLIRPSLTV